GVASDNVLPHHRIAGFRRLAENRIVRRHGAPTEHGLAFGLHDLLEFLFGAPAQRRVARQKDDAAAVSARRGQLEAELLRDRGQELVRHLQEHASAVAGVRLGAAGPAVIEIRQDLEPLLQDLVRFSAFRIDDEADAAGVMFICWVVQPLLFWPGRPITTLSVSVSRAHSWPIDVVIKFADPTGGGAGSPCDRWRQFQTDGGPPEFVSLLNPRKPKGEVHAERGCRATRYLS